MRVHSILVRGTLLFLLAGTLATSPALASPKSGFGLYGGIINATDDITPTGGGTSSSLQSSGLSLGVDYQFQLSGSTSANIFYETSNESVTGDASFKGSYDSVNHTVLGVGLRFWSGTFFFGAHLGNYTETLTAKYGGGTLTTSGTGTGGGISLGVEGGGGAFFALQGDSANIAYSGASGNLLTTRVHVGYRF